MTGFISAQDCTYESALSWLKSKYPNGEITTTTSDISGCSYVLVDGTVALKEDKGTRSGFRLCNRFVFEWNREQFLT